MPSIGGSQGGSPMGGSGFSGMGNTGYGMPTNRLGRDIELGDGHVAVNAPWLPGTSRGENIVVIDSNQFNPLLRGKSLPPGAWDSPTFYGLNDTGKQVADYARPAVEKYYEQPKQKKSESRVPFKIDPNQVQNDLDAGGTWGGQPQMPQMNPFSMYGSQMASPLDGGNYGANRYQQYANTGSPFPSFDWGSFFSGGK